jgi:iron complex transport system substrate-binding protein
LCDHPGEIAGRPVCTRGAEPVATGDAPLIQVDEAMVESLQPDLILSDWPKHRVADFTARCPHAGRAPERTPDLWANIQAVAEVLGMTEPGRVLLAGLKSRFVDIISQTCLFKNRTEVVCIESVTPLRTVGWWLPELVEFAGGQALFAQAGRAPMPLEWAALEHANPEFILVMIPGMDLAAARDTAQGLVALPGWRKLAAARAGKVFLTDARHFLTRPGPRVVESLQILSEILHPKTFNFGGEGKRWQRL